MLLYIICLIMFVMPVMVMEFAVGRASQLSSTRSFKALRPEHGIWSIWGYIGWLGNLILMMYYTVVTGWLLAYMYNAAIGSFDNISAHAAGEFFAALLSSPTSLILWMALAVIIGSAICFSSLRSGVESITKIMMTCLLVIMIVLAVRALTLPGSQKGLEFYLKPDFDKMFKYGFGETLYSAMGQAFFTLSVGIGSMAIFGSYISRERSLTGESLIVTSLDTFVALTAGLIIFPTCFAYGIEPDAGPGLLFVTLPETFSNMPLGRLWCALFFLFMSFAALSTVVAVFENLIAGLMDMFKWPRQKACFFVMLLVFILSVPCALGFNLWANVKIGSAGILDIEDFIVSNNLLPFGAIIYLLFCTTRYGWGWDAFVKEADEGEGIKFPAFLRLYFKYVVPVIMLIIFALGYYEVFSK